MKLARSYRRNHGLTLMETVVIACLLIIIVALLLPTFHTREGRESRFNCIINQKQIGLAFRIWENDNNERYPMAVSITNGGAMEAILAGKPLMVFQVMSNELSTPKVLVCPQDIRRRAATNFNLTPGNVSYFVNVDATEAKPLDIMGGDDNLEINGIRIKSGLSVISSNSPITWSADRHKFECDVMMADGSVQGMNNSMLKNYLLATNFTSMRLAIP